MRVGEDKIQEIRAAADIVEIVGGLVRLKKAGRGFAGLCPFHKEKTPSFHVNPERGTYKCFGCGKGGDVFSFLIETKKVSFIEAVEELAARYHISLPRDTERDIDTEALRGRLLAVTKQAAEFFYTLLRAPEGEAGWRYAAQRGWGADVLRRFGVGYAPEAWDGLSQRAERDGWDGDALVEAGVLGLSEAGRRYDRFRHRLIFPIILPGKHVVGFGGRSLRAEDTPKYLNSPETPIYTKSRVLYGLTQATDAIRREGAVIVVEGYADVLSLHQAGVAHVVATCGTALTPEHVKLVRRLSRNVFFLYDADAAGLRAMERGIEVMVEQGFDPKIVVLPEGEDPDSFVRSRGGEAVREACDKALSFVDWLAKRGEGGEEGPEARTELVRRLVGLLARMQDALRREFYVRHLAGTYGIAESTLYGELARQAQTLPRVVVEELEEEINPLPVSTHVDVALPRFEKAVLQAVLHAPASVRDTAARFLRLEKFRDPRLRAVLSLMLEELEHAGSFEVEVLERKFENETELIHTIWELLAPQTEPSPNWKNKQVVKDLDYKADILFAWKQLNIQVLDQFRERLERRYRVQASNIEEEDFFSRINQDIAQIRFEISTADSFDALDACDQRAEALMTRTLA